METIFNYYTVNIIYPSLNEEAAFPHPKPTLNPIASHSTRSSSSAVYLPAKLQEGFPLLLPRNTSLNSVELQIQEDFLLLGANVN
ncbi:lipopolysaccharide-binding protein-like [Sciurus carolinensis]|uniref:lipopolysaccharide-binding protein-like n=1 Tax=Sciurus carolinensis TaxID=30640 RepID=UPI001FB56357|nr:lipopolysaccharide-binding protein-like [Sciurus carolinensis]